MGVVQWNDLIWVWERSFWLLSEEWTGGVQGWKQGGRSGGDCGPGVGGDAVSWGGGGGRTKHLHFCVHLLTTPALGPESGTPFSPPLTGVLSILG